DGPCSTRVIEKAVTPQTCTAKSNFYLFQSHHAYTCNSLIYASLQQEHLGNRIGNSCRNRQRLELSWSHRNTHFILRRDQICGPSCRFWRYKRWTVVYLARTPSLDL
ncbi:hypothetical protein P692DRAFT_20738228, partial [Suillus brevipes Sb2]